MGYTVKKLYGPALLEGAYDSPKNILVNASAYQFIRVKHIYVANTTADEHLINIGVSAVSEEDVAGKALVYGRSIYGHQEWHYYGDQILVPTVGGVTWYLIAYSDTANVLTMTVEGEVGMGVLI